MRNFFQCSALLAISVMMCLVFLCTDNVAAAIGYRGVARELMPNGSIGQMLSGVMITFFNQQSGVKRTAFTDQRGSYGIKLDKGSYHVTAQHCDYEDYSSAPGVWVVTGIGTGYEWRKIFLKQKVVTTILLIRHAEKELTPYDPDPPLSPAGQARADELVHVVSKAAVKAIFATDTRRSKQTVQPLANYLNISVSSYSDANVEVLKELKKSILSNHAGKVVLVAGHSNTFAIIITTFGDDGSKCTVNDDEYDNLCVITVYTSGKANVVNLKYGATSP